ncbi:MAG: transposase [Leptospirales bacterium]|nr:transposase [Leptospirales bacterium]
MGRAIAYAWKLWPRLTVYVEHGELEIDNNLTENAIRPFVVGRKNWLFSCVPAGARASALLYSIIETAKANGHEPFSYLRHLFLHFPDNRNNIEAVRDLMPCRLSPAAVHAAFKSR